MNLRSISLALVLLALGCSQDDDSGRVTGREAGVDVGPGTGDGPGDRKPSPDARPPADTDIADRSNLADAASAETTGDVGAPFDVPTADSLAWDAPAEGVSDSGNPPNDGGCNPADEIPIDRLPAISFATYHTQPQITAYLQAVAAAVPCLAQYKVLGQSMQGRDLPYLVIDATGQPNPPAVFANGTHHGDEPASTEAALWLPDCLLRKSVTDAPVRDLLRRYAFYVLPVVNPDGQAANNRLNAGGLDINRDYSYPERSDADSFKTAEARLIKSLQERVGFRAAIAFHSGAQEVLWPWCYSGSATIDDGFFTAAGQKTAQAMSFAVYQQSFDDYPTTGEYIDYAYWKSQTLAATFEVSTVKTPSAASLAGVVDSACKGSIAWVQAVADHAAGRLHALSGAAGGRKTFPLTAPFNGVDRLE
jgi:hypothetical protein